MEKTPPDLQSTQMELSIEKLELEIRHLKQTISWDRKVGRVLPILSALVPALALLFAVQQFVAQ